MEVTNEDTAISPIVMHFHLYGMRRRVYYTCHCSIILYNL